MSFSSEMDAAICPTTPALTKKLTHSYKAYFFGPFRITCDNQPISESEWRRNKAKTLLKWFLLNPGKLCTTDRLIELIWPGMTAGTASRNLHVTVHHLRYLLEPWLTTGQESRFIHHNRNKYYWFEMDGSWWTDILDIQHLSIMARGAEEQDNHHEALTCYHKIIEYCSLGFLPEDIYNDLFHPYRHQYERLYTETLEKLIQFYTQTERFDELLACSYQILAFDPYSELAIKAIINTSCRQGNLIEAIRKLDDFQNFLTQEGMIPSKGLSLLREKMVEAR